MSIELIYNGEDTVVKMLNEENGTTYTTEQVIIGNPTSSADVDYNTDIDITIKKEALPEGTVPEDEIGVTLPIHYNRLDLGRLFAKKHLTLRPAEGETIDNIVLAEAIAKEVKVIFETDAGKADLLDVTVDPATLPTSVLLRAAENSLRFTGQFAVDVAKPIVQDTTIITEIDEDVNAPIAAPAALKSDGTLQSGTGNPNGKLLVATNGELEVAAGARLFKNYQLITPVDNSYELVVGETADWNYPYSFALKNKKNGSVITDLYDITLKVTATDGGGVLNFTLKREFGKLAFVDTANDLRIVTGFVADDQSVYQDIQRVSLYKQAFGSIETNDGGALLGEFTFEVKAVRKQASGIDPVIITYTVNVVKEAGGAEPTAMRFASFDEAAADEEVVDDTTTGEVADEPTADETPAEVQDDLSDVPTQDDPEPTEAPAEAPTEPEAVEQDPDFTFTAYDAEGTLNTFTGGADQSVWIKIDDEFVEAQVADLEVGNVIKVAEGGSEFTVESVTDNRPAA